MNKTKTITRKQKAFADHLLNNPKDSATEAATQTYNIKKRHTAEQIAYENLRKPEIVSYLATHSKDIENALINTFNQYKEEEDIGKRKHSSELGMWMHDKIHGKATQTVEQHITEVKLSLNLRDVTPKD